MSAEPPNAVADAGRSTPRLVRRLRMVLLCAIALLFVASIPWYRGDESAGRLLGLPDWVAVALLCYALAALLNAIAWLLTDIPDSNPERERRAR